MNILSTSKTSKGIAAALQLHLTKVAAKGCFVLSILLTACLPATLSADNNVQFVHYGIESGLSQNTVSAITQDQRGFMWFGTRNGLNRFDGNNYKIFHRGTSEGDIKTDNINALLSTDDGQIWIGCSSGLYTFDATTESFNHFDVKSDDGIQIDGNINGLYRHGSNIIIVTSSQGIFYYDTSSHRLRHNACKGHYYITAVAVDNSQRIWLSFFGEALYYTDSTLRDLKPYYTADNKMAFNGVTIKGIIATEQQQLFVGTDGYGISELNLNIRTITPVMPEITGKGKFIHSLARRGNEIVIGTENGLYIYQMLTHDLQHYQYEASNPFSLADNSIQSLYCDSNDGLWAGTYFSGVCYSSAKPTLFKKYFPRIDIPNSIHGRRVRDIAEDPQGFIWIGTEDGGLNRFDPVTQQFTYISESAAFPNIHGLSMDNGLLWVGTFSYGIKVIDTKSLKVVKQFKSSNDPRDLHDNNIFAITTTHDGKIYIGTLGGLCVYDNNGHFDYDTNVSNSIVYDIFEDSSYNLWVVQYGNSLSKRDGKTGKWKTYSMANKTLPTKNVLNITEISPGNIWATTEDYGVLRYDNKRDIFVQQEIHSIKNNATTYCALADKTGKIWITTNYGLVCHTPSNGGSQLFTTGNGLLSNNFNFNSVMLSKNGDLYLGSLEGVVSIKPEQLQDTNIEPNIIATELYLNNNPVLEYGDNSPLQKSITLTDHLELAYNQNTFAIQIASLLYANDQQVELEYMLDGYENSWMALPADNIVHFTNLPIGSYKLKVRARSSKETIVGKVFEMKITIAPPFYRSWWAYSLYALLILLAAFIILRETRRRALAKRRYAMQQFQYEKEQELYQSKINFFTNVAHEIRTPLTLIKAPLDNMLKQRNIEKDSMHDLSIMEQNVSRLLNLTNQLLDFRKAERDGLRLNIERCNINKLVDGVYVRFTSLMREKNIQSELNMPEEAIYAYVDKESVTKIISNMLNNAVKYCEHQVILTLSTDQQDNVKVTLSNDGPLVPAKLRKQIFEPFERGTSHTSTTPGTGIGLALARALAELHEGTLSMQDDDVMNVFVLTIPMQNATSIEMSPNATGAVEDNSEDADSDNQQLPTILIVEDNMEMQKYEKSQLANEYHVLTASNGEEAMQIIASNDNIEIIVSDVMMEPIGGFELCRTIKNNVDYSHIPIILLTALTLDSAKVEGMESGADAYIEKPYSMDYLRSSIHNLIRQRNSIKSAYANSPFIQNESISISEADQKFISKLNELMQQNMSNSDFNVNDMAAALCMSRTNLNRKIRGTFNLSPNNYIKVERLKRAAQLMKAEHLRVGEVCYKVGFTSPSYFTQCFFKQFGLLPKDFVDKNGE